MQRVPWMRTIGIIIACVLLVGLSQTLAAATRSPGAPMQQMRGAITAIDTAANTVVIDVRQGKEQFTIGGPLSPKAVVKKGGKVSRTAVPKVCRRRVRSRRWAVSSYRRNRSWAVRSGIPRGIL